jgi:hypothetical protein
MSKYADVAPTIIGATSQTDEQIDAKIDALETVETVDNTPVIDQSKIAAFNSIALEGTIFIDKNIKSAGGISEVARLCGLHHEQVEVLIREAKLMIAKRQAEAAQ